MRRRITLISTGAPEHPALDTALSRALLLRTGAGERGETLRLHETGPVVAFSVLDRTRPGFTRAVAVARELGFAPVLRLAGGRAAVFHEGTLAIAWSVPARDPRAGIRARFEEASSIVAAALRRLGVEARVGEVPGEYCPGAYSVNARGRRKLAGLGQRVVAGAAHVGGVVVARGSARAREALEPVYAALGLPLDPDTIGSVEDEVGGATVDGVRRALLAELATRHHLEADDLRDSDRELARRLAPDHEAAAGGRSSHGPVPAGPKHVIERRAPDAAVLARAPETR